MKGYLEGEGIDTSGDKKDLIRRIKQRNHYDDFLEFEFKLGVEGEKYFKSNQWIKYYLVHMDTFDLIEFKDYFHKSGDDFNNASLKFLNKHLNHAIERSDFMALFDALSSKAMYYIINNDLTSALNEEMKLFIVRLNPTCEGDKLAFHKPTERVNVHNLKIMIKLCKTDDLKGLFNRNWNALEYEKTWFNQKSSFNSSIKALKTKKLDDLMEIDGRYFE